MDIQLLFNNRLYEPTFPGVNDIVMVQIYDITELGAKCKLLEYGEIDGFVPINEFSKRRIKSMKQIFQKGFTYPLQVIGVEEHKGYVDLSKKHLTETEIKQCIHRFKEAKVADNILQRTATLCSVPKIEIYEKCIWPMCAWPMSTFPIHHDLTGERVDANKSNENDALSNVMPNDALSNVMHNTMSNTLSTALSFNDSEKTIISALQVLEHLTKRPSLIDPYNIDQSIKNMLIQLSIKKLQTTSKKLSSTLQLTCFGTQGVRSIKHVLSQGMLFSKEISHSYLKKDENEETNGDNEKETVPSAKNEQFQLNVFANGCPDYELTVDTKNTELGIQFMTDVIQHMENEMKGIEGGTLVVKKAPFVLGE